MFFSQLFGSGTVKKAQKYSFIVSCQVGPWFRNFLLIGLNKKNYSTLLSILSSYYISLRVI
jgi:hypothetical protein